MKRLAFGLFLVLANPGIAAAAEAPAAGAGETADEKAPEAETPAPEASEVKKDELPDLSDEVKEATSEKEEATAAATAARRSWEDIVVVPRKAFLKGGRFELAPFSAISINDAMIRHYAFGGDLTYYLTDVFSVGAEGQYFIKERSERESLVGYQFNRVTTLNRFKYSTSLVFGYVPGYGKFGLFNKYIVHWDVTVNAGIGLIWTEIIPVIPDNAAWGNLDICPHFAISTRMFVTDWFALSIGLRDYIFLDKFEPLNRASLVPTQAEINAKTPEVQIAKEHATSSLTQNVMVFGSIGFFLPPSFQYKTPR
ncbi:MAG: outer membrane beta-barrel domain-containing protein [Polyangia bacterium]|jgi:outer membrane beta-barrel protein